MIQIVWTLSLAVFLSSAGVKASPLKDFDPSKDYLVDMSKRRAIEVQGNLLLTERVYLRFNAMLKKWIFVVTTDQAKFSSPDESILPGSVVLGAWLGAEPAQHFRLTSEADWLPTQEELNYQFLVLGNPQTLKTIRYEPHASHRVLTAKR